MNPVEDETDARVGITAEDGIQGLGPGDDTREEAENRVDRSPLSVLN